MRIQAIVVSSARFHRVSQRAIVVPELRLPIDELLDPWRFAIGGRLYAADHTQTLRIERVLEVVTRLPFAELRKVQRTIGTLVSGQ